MLQAARRQLFRCHVAMRDPSRVHVTIRDLQFGCKPNLTAYSLVTPPSLF